MRLQPRDRSVPVVAFYSRLYLVDKITDRSGCGSRRVKTRDAANNPASGIPRFALVSGVAQTSSLASIWASLCRASARLPVSFLIAT